MYDNKYYDFLKEKIDIAPERLYRDGVTAEKPA